MNILNLTSENFDKEVLQSDKTVLVDFGQVGVCLVNDVWNSRRNCK